MKIRLCFVAVSLLLVTCIRYYPDIIPSLPAGANATVTLQSNYVSSTASQLIFDADISWLSADQFYVYVDQGSLKFSGSGKYTLIDSLEGTLIGTPGSSSSVILVDQSGTYDSIDPFNNRSKGINKFCKDTKSPGNFWLGGFSRQGRLHQEPVEYFQSNFSTDATGQLSFLFDLATRTGGISSLYDAVDDAIDQLAGIQATSNKKNIVVLAHSNDAGSFASPDSIIAKAILNHVKINILLLGNNVSPSATAKLSQATGGIFTACPTDKEMITVFNLLNHLLNEAGSVSKIRIQYEPASGNILPGEETVHTLVVHDAVGNFDYTPLIFYVKVPG